jgi:hypothetical protein
VTDNASFRHQLDTVLRTRDVQEVRSFLIAEKQWSEELPSDPEFAMWMMIAGSQTLRDLHEQARKWLVSHGHEAEAEALLRREREASSKQGKKGRLSDSQKKQRKT